MIKIAMLDSATLGDVDLSIFNELGDFKEYKLTAPEQTIERLKDVDVVITNKVLITEDVIANTNLKLICVSATGVDNIDLKAAKERGIEVKNVAGYSTNSVTQQTFASLLTLTNKVCYYNSYCLDGKWTKSKTFTHLEKPFFELNGKTFGIIGLGDIGKSVANVAKSFGCEVIYYSTSGKNSNKNYKKVELDELLRSCDIISIHAPLNENTKNLISKNELVKLKKGAILMNFGRGGIVDEKEVAKQIDSSDLKFITDVLESEPMRADHPFLKVKNRQNLLITPHVAWASIEARKRLIEIVAKNIKESFGA